MENHTVLRYSAAAAGVLFLILTGTTIATGVSQQWFEQLHGLDDYTRRMLAEGSTLRAILSVDDVFVASYVVATAALTRSLGRASEPWSTIALTAVSMGGLLDYIENHHMLSQLRTLETGGILSLAAIQAQMIGSSLKWLLGHVAFVALAVAIRPKDAVDRCFQFALLGIQLPVGVLVWTHPHPIWYWARALCFLLGFVYIASRAKSLAGNLQPLVDPTMVADTASAHR